MAVQYYEGIGRRKESTARVRLMNGTGKMVVNDKPAEDYFTRLGDLDAILAPLSAIGAGREQYDISVKVNGGGVTGQTDAVKLGLARALLELDATNKPALRKGGFVTRDSRGKERKKPGLKRARKAPTYTKR